MAEGREGEERRGEERRGEERRQERRGEERREIFETWLTNDQEQETVAFRGLISPIFRNVWGDAAALLRSSTIGFIPQTNSRTNNRNNDPSAYNNAAQCCNSLGTNEISL